MPYTTSFPSTATPTTSLTPSAPPSSPPTPPSRVRFQTAPHTPVVEPSHPKTVASHVLPMPLSRKYLHPRALSRPLLLLPPHVKGHVQPPSHPEVYEDLSTGRWRVDAALPQTTNPPPIIVGTIVGPVPTNVNTNTPVPTPSPVPVQSPAVTSSALSNTTPSTSTANTSGTTASSATSSPTSSAAESTTSPPLPIPPTLGQPSDNSGSSDGNDKSFMSTLEMFLIPTLTIAVTIILIVGAWLLWGPGGRFRKRRGGQGQWWWKGGGGRQKRRGGRKGSRDLDGAVLAFIGGSGRLRRDGSLIYGPAYETGTGDAGKRGAIGPPDSPASHGMIGQRYPSSLHPPRTYRDDDDDGEDDGKELGYLGSTPTKASTRPYNQGSRQAPGRFKWPDLSISTLRRGANRRNGAAGVPEPPHDFRRHLVDLSAHQQVENEHGYAYRYQNPYEVRQDRVGGAVTGAGGVGPREGFSHWGVSLQETYYDEALVFPYTDYPENEREWMKENGTLPKNRKEVHPVAQFQSSGINGTAVISRNHSEVSESVYPPSRAMSKRSAGTIQGLALEDGGKGKRLLEEVKKEKSWMDSIRGIWGGGTSGTASAVDEHDREALVSRGHDPYIDEEESTPRALSRGVTMKTRSSQGYSQGQSPDQYSRSPEYPLTSAKGGSIQQQGLTAPSKRRTHRRGDSDAYVMDAQQMEVESQATPTQALFRGGSTDEVEMASFGTAMHDLSGREGAPRTPDRRPRLSNARRSYAPLRDREDEEARRDRYTPKPVRTRESRSRSRDGSTSPSRYARTPRQTVSSESVPLTIRHVESAEERAASRKSPSSMAMDVLPRSPPQVTSPPLESQMYFSPVPDQKGPDIQTPSRGHAKSRKVRSKNPPSASTSTSTSHPATPARKTASSPHNSHTSSKPVPPPLIPPDGSASTAHNRSDITFTSRLTERTEAAQSQAMDKLGRIVESSWNVREQAIGEEGVRALSPTAFGRKVQG